VKRCRMCESKFILQDKVPEDGLCLICHMNLCQKETEDCPRCSKAMEALSDFIDIEEG